MRWIVFLLALLLISGGGASLALSIDLIGIERGSMYAICGVIALAAGILTFAVGVAIGRIEALTAALAPAPALPDLNLPEPPGRPFEAAPPVAPPVTIAAAEPISAPLIETPVPPPAPAPVERPGLRPGPSAGSIGGAAGAAALAASAYALREMGKDDAPELRPALTEEPVEPVEEPAPPVPPVMERVEAEPVAEPDLAVADVDADDETVAPAPEPLETEQVETASDAAEPVTEDAVVEAEAEDIVSNETETEPAPVEAEAAPAAPSSPDPLAWLDRALAGEPEKPVAPPAPPPPPPKPTPSVVGRYTSGGVNYTMYSDGSIEAETPNETLRFASMRELKAFIEKRATGEA